MGRLRKHLKEKETVISQDVSHSKPIVQRGAEQERTYQQSLERLKDISLLLNKKRAAGSIDIEEMSLLVEEASILFRYCKSKLALLEDVMTVFTDNTGWSSPSSTSEGSDHFGFGSSDNDIPF